MDTIDQMNLQKALIFWSFMPFINRTGWIRSNVIIKRDVGREIPSPENLWISKSKGNYWQYKFHVEKSIWI